MPQLVSRSLTCTIVTGTGESFPWTLLVKERAPASSSGGLSMGADCVQCNAWGRSLLWAFGNDKETGGKAASVMIIFKQKLLRESYMTTGKQQVRLSDFSQEAVSRAADLEDLQCSRKQTYVEGNEMWMSRDDSSNSWVLVLFLLNCAIWNKISIFISFFRFSSLPVLSARVMAS